jgi:hypothetical protein
MISSIDSSLLVNIFGNVLLKAFIGIPGSYVFKSEISIIYAQF